MDSIAKSDIFFVITTLAVIIVTIIVIVTAVYVVNILKTLKYITSRVREETDKISDDLEDIRQHARKKSFGVLALGTLFKKMFDRHKSSKSKRA